MSSVLTLTPRALLGLFFIQRYRFLTIAQFARASGLSRHRSEDLLHSLEGRGLLGYFGFVRIPGHGHSSLPGACAAGPARKPLTPVGGRIGMTKRGFHPDVAIAHLDRTD